MTTSDSPYITRDELAARLAELELRIEQRLNDHFRNQTRLLLTLILPLYAAVAIAAVVFAVR